MAASQLDKEFIMRLNRIAASAAIAGALTSGALGVGAGLAQADPNGPNVPGPVPGPNVPGPGPVPGQNVPGPMPGQGVPICNAGPGVNCTAPGTPLPPGQNGFPPPGHYNDPIGYGLPARWMPPGQPGDYPVVFNPGVNQWGVFLPDGQFVAYAT
ncbi:hypothetical protein MMARJ_08780 [Mycobacterium marseillense]|uniref:Uncharacterized protein n=3 Tax=Mycobacterium marseillense TaxID=701042 RepID=A0ABN5ZPV8_9MYCO|nr:hypothetical protein MMARJ_08780 [Mycobacterium marseillense]